MRVTVWFTWIHDENSSKNISYTVNVKIEWGLIVFRHGKSMMKTKLLFELNFAWWITLNIAWGQAKVQVWGSW